MIKFRAVTDPKTLAPILREQIKVSTTKILFDSLAYVICNAYEGRVTGFKGCTVSWETIPKTNYGEVEITVS